MDFLFHGAQPPDGMGVATRPRFNPDCNLDAKNVTSAGAAKQRVKSTEIVPKSRSTAAEFASNLILLLPISGWLHDSAFKDAAAHPLRLFWIIPWFRIATIQDLPPAAKESLHGELFALHLWSTYALGALVALHIAGALKHQFLDRHPELQRMG